jgi:hypothetical protein
MEIGNHCSRVELVYTQKDLCARNAEFGMVSGVLFLGLSLNRGLLGRATIKDIIVFKTALHVRLRTFDRQE